MQGRPGLDADYKFSAAMIDHGRLTVEFDGGHGARKKNMNPIFEFAPSYKVSHIFLFSTPDPGMEEVYLIINS